MALIVIHLIAKSALYFEEPHNEMGSDDGFCLSGQEFGRFSSAEFQSTGIK